MFKFVLGKHGISIQRYWNGALVGPDCRRLLENHAAILEDVRKGIVAAGFGEAEARDFVDTHTAVLKELVVVSRLTRRVDGAGANRCLSEGERTELKRACAAFGAAWRANFFDKSGQPRRLTIKGHIVEVHVPEFVDLFHACGVFGRTARRRCTWWTRCAGASYARYTTRSPATRRTPCTTLGGSSRQSCSCSGAPLSGSRKRRWPRPLQQRPPPPRLRHSSALLLRPRRCKYIYHMNARFSGLFFTHVWTGC